MNTLFLLLFLIVVFNLNTAVSLSKNLYTVLGVETDATTSQIKKAYHKLALELHPDKNKKPTDEDGEMTPEDELEMEDIIRRFIEIVSAYETLSNPNSRKRYDTVGDEGNNSERASRAQKKQYGDQPFHMHSRFSGGSFEFHYTGKKIKTMQNLMNRIDITLEELYSGKTQHNITVNRQRLCHHCQGTGAEKEELIEVCPLCQGTGFAMYLHDTCTNKEDHDHDHDHHDHEDHENHDHHHHHHHHQSQETGLQQIVNTTCNKCTGTGKIVPANATCNVCGGVGTLTEPKVYTLNVTHDGQTIRFLDGGQAMDHVDGQVLFEVHAKEHSRFKIAQKYNLIYDARVDLVDALVGFEKYVTHLNGKKIPIIHDIVTFHGYQHVVENEGLPMPGTNENKQKMDEKDNNKDTKEKRGNLIVNFDVVFPRILTDAQREALKNVMDEDDVGVLEDVIALAAATQDAKDYKIERLYSNECLRNELVCRYDVLYVLRGDGIVV